MSDVHSSLRAIAALNPRLNAVLRVNEDAAEATALRDDLAASQPADPARNAPQWADGYFVVPKVIGE